MSVLSRLPFALAQPDSLDRPRAVVWLLAVASLIALPGLGQSAGDLAIPTYPVGLVTGELLVQAELGATATPATLYLDGEAVCEMTTSQTSCTVDLGPDPHVHLLELVRPAASGRDVERAFRWINRPGQEAELRLQLSPADASGQCKARVFTNHPQRQRPVVLEVLLNGNPLPFGSDGAAAVPCPTDDASHILVASGIFPDGRRVEDVRLIGGYAGRAESELTALPVLADQAGDCTAVDWPDEVVRVEKANYEVVIVLDPSVPFQSIFKTGWHLGSGSAAKSTDKAFDTFVGDEGSDMRPLATWQRAEVPFQTAEKIWYVAPGEGLPRINGFSAGKKNWLQLLFKFGMSDFPGNPRLADAVASSGLVAGAGPRRRAVILILGNKSKDESVFSPQQAMNYLAEVGVPLVVLRSGKPKGDGWPEGLKNANMNSMAKNLEATLEELERQCVAWFEGGSRRPTQLAASLPTGFHVAGHGDTPPATLWDSLSTTELAELRGLEAAEEAETKTSPATRQFTGRLDLVSVTVLISAEDAAGEPIVDLRPDDLVVTEDGKTVNIVDLERLDVRSPRTQVAPPPAVASAQEAPEPLPVSIYIEPALAARGGLRAALGDLAENAKLLTALGPVEVVVARSQAETVLALARDPLALAAFLDEFDIPTASRPAIEDIRTRYIRDIRQTYGHTTQGTSLRDDPSDDRLNLDGLGSNPDDAQNLRTAPAQIKMRTLAAAGEEFSSVAASLDVLSRWMQSKEIGEPRLLLLIGTGFDENPTEFYVPMARAIEPQSASDLQSRLDRYHKGKEVNQAAQALAGNSWRVIALATSSTGGSTISASERGGDRFQSFLTDADLGTSLQPGFLLLDPLEAQRRVSRPSGGDVALGARGLGEALDRASGWYRLTYQAERTPDGAVHQLATSTARDGVSLRAPEVVTSESSEGRAENRLRLLLAGDAGEGLLPVSAKTVDVSSQGKKVSGTVEITTDLAQLQDLMQSLGGGAFRVSVLVTAEGAEPSAAHQTVTLEPMAGFIHTLPIEWSTGTARLAIGVEDLASGEWGGTILELGS